MGKIDNRKDVLLLLLFSPGRDGEEGEPIEGRTRLMKLLYLLHRDLEVEKKLGIERPYSFEAYHYGPFSKDLYNDLEFLENVGLVESITKGLASPVEQNEEERVRDDVSIGNPDEDSEQLFVEERFKLTEKGKEFVRDDLLPHVPESIMSSIIELKRDIAPRPLTSILRYVYSKYPDSAENTKLQYLTS